jgi:MFS family permease
VIGCAAFALAHSFIGLALARALIGVGVSACLMAPLTAYRRSFAPVAQLRANSWMLMAGSTGMVASTLPVQWLQPLLGWRGLFWAVAAVVLLGMLATAWIVPRDAPASASLWAGPWLAEVCGWTPTQAAEGLFAINVAMLISFMSWGSIVPRLYARGWTAQRLIARGAPVSLVALVLAVMLGAGAGAWVWVMFCAACSVVALAQPAVGLALPAQLAGRALSAYNLLIFLGVFTLQWGIGLSIDVLRARGWSTLSAYRGSFALLTVCCALSYVWFLCRPERAAAAERHLPA